MIVQPTLFAPIIQYVVFAYAKNVTFEIEDNYQKQTYRNRYYIYTSMGKQLMTVPILHLKKEARIKTKEVKIDYSTSWQKLHVKSINSAYSSSPFYEYYKDDLLPVFQKKYKFLLDLNFDVNDRMNDCLELNFKVEKTKKFQLIKEKGLFDFRNLAIAKNNSNYQLEKYTQVFDNKYGFIANLSILDLLFNEGPNTIMYLEKHKNLLF